MVRGFYIFIIVLLFQNCCYKGFRNEYGMPRKNIKIDNVVDQDIYSKIDTLCLYEYLYRYEDPYPKRLDLAKDYNGKQYIRFYGNGKYSLFGFEKSTTNLPDGEYQFTRDDFNPKKSIMGYYYSKNNRLFSKIFGTNQCQAYIFKSEFLIKKDTIIEINNNASSYYYIYIKRKYQMKYWKTGNPIGS